MATKNNTKPEFENVINQVEETPIEAIKAQVDEAEIKAEESIIEAAMEDLEKEIKAEKTAKKKSLPKKNKAAKKEELKIDLKKTSKKEKAIKDTVDAHKKDIVEKVISNREVKWIYPEDCTDTLSRKSWRQKQRNKIHQLERDLYRIDDRNSKEYKAAIKKLNAKKAEVLKPGMEIG